MKDNPSDPDSPIWEGQDFDRAKPADEVLPPHLALLLVRAPAWALGMQVARQSRLARGLKIAA